MTRDVDDFIRIWGHFKTCLLLTKLRDNCDVVDNLEFHDFLIDAGIIGDPTSFEEFYRVYLRFFLRANKHFNLLDYRKVQSNTMNSWDDDPKDRTKWALYYNLWEVTPFGLDIINNDVDNQRLRKAVNDHIQEISLAIQRVSRRS